MGQTLPRLKAGARLSPLDLGAGRSYLLQLPDGRSLRLSPYAYEILARLDGERTIAQIAEEMSGVEGRPVSENEVRWVLEQKLRVLGLLEEGGCGPNDRERGPGPDAGLRAPSRMASLPVTAFRAVVAACSPFHAPIALMLLAPAILAAHFRLYAVLGVPEIAAQTLKLSASGWVLVTGLVLACITIHELGHLSAYYRFTGEFGTMRVGFHRLLPYGVAVVPNPWTLASRQRLVFTFGGVWFQLLAALGLSAAYALNRSGEIALTLFLMDVGVLWVLSPAGRTDGYWIVADLLGVSSLESTSRAHTPADIPADKTWRDARPFCRRASAALAILAVIHAGLQWLLWSFVFSLTGRWKACLTPSPFSPRHDISGVAILGVIDESVRLCLPLVLVCGLVLASVRSAVSILKTARRFWRHGEGEHASARSSRGHHRDRRE